jgi:hypothetical protein
VRKMYKHCPLLNTIRIKHKQLTPREFTLEHGTWRTEGWAPCSMRLKEDTTRRETRKLSKEKRELLGKELDPGDVFGIYCGGSGEATSKFFWLAEACPQNVQSNRVVSKAAKWDPAWDFNKGDDVLNIRWLERVDEENRPRACDPHGAEQTIPLKATLPRAVPEWEKTSTNRRVLTANDEDEYIEMCRASWRRSRHTICYAIYSRNAHRGLRVLRGGGGRARRLLYQWQHGGASPSLPRCRRQRRASAGPPIEPHTGGAGRSAEQHRVTCVASCARCKPRRHSVALGKLSSGLPSARCDDIHSVRCPLFRASFSLFARTQRAPGKKRKK